MIHRGTWHPETLLIVGALGDWLGRQGYEVRAPSDATAREAFAASTDVVRWASRHKLVAMTNDYVSRLGLTDDRLARAHRNGTLHCLRLAVVTARAYQVLADAGCRPLAIKGVTLSQLAMNNVGTRGPGDLDFVVSPQALPAAIAALRSEGATVGPAVQAQWRFHAVNLKYEGLSIDLHHRLTLSRTVGITPGLAWERGMDLEIAGRPVRTLSLVDTTVLAAVSAGLDTWSQLGRVADFGRLLVMLQEAGHGELLQEAADQWRARHQLTLGFAMLRRLCTDVPTQDWISERLAQQAWLWTAQARQLRLDQDQRSRYEREVYRVLGTRTPGYTAWAVARNLTRSPGTH